MKYIEGMDYWVRYVRFPNMASESVAASHGDGTFTIYINTLFPEEKQQERLRHELRHLEQEHFYRDGLTIREVERCAEGLSHGGAASRPSAAPAPAAAVSAEALPTDGAPLRPGDVGWFRYRGETVCRQYHRDVFGITYLFALDRSRSGEDILIPASGRGELTCLARVLLPSPLPLPGLR